jgi:hypothetical protein
MRRSPVLAIITSGFRAVRRRFCIRRRDVRELVEAIARKRNAPIMANRTLGVCCREHFGNMVTRHAGFGHSSGRGPAEIVRAEIEGEALDTESTRPSCHGAQSSRPRARMVQARRVGWTRITVAAATLVVAIPSRLSYDSATSPGCLWVASRQASISARI